MSELQEGSTKKEKISKKILASTGKSFSYDDFLIKKGEVLRSLRIEANFSNEVGKDRKVKFSLNRNFRSGKSNNSAVLALSLFTLLSGNKNINAKRFIIFLIQNNLLSSNELKSLIPINNGGRKRKSLNKETGTISNMKYPYKDICEMFNKGREPEEIRDTIFPSYKSPKGKSERLSFVRRILRRNKDFLTRPYGQK